MTSTTNPDQHIRIVTQPTFQIADPLTRSWRTVERVRHQSTIVKNNSISLADSTNAASTGVKPSISRSDIVEDPGFGRHGIRRTGRHTTGNGNGRRYVIKPWRKNVLKPYEARKRALLMPGIGYTCQNPLLYWSAVALIEDGWYVDYVEADFSGMRVAEAAASIEPALDEWDEMTRRDAPRSVSNGDQTDGLPARLVITKSLSTFNYPHIVRMGVPCVLMTPVLAYNRDVDAVIIPSHDGDDTVSVQGSLANVTSAHMPTVPADAGDPLSGDALSATPLALAGSADALWDLAAAQRLTPEVHEFAGANHSIEVPGDWRTSMAYIGQAVGYVADYARRCADGR